MDPQTPEVTSLTEARALSLLPQTEEEKSAESIRVTTSPAAIVPAICALPPLTSCEGKPSANSTGLMIGSIQRTCFTTSAGPSSGTSSMSNIMPMAAGCSVTDARGVTLHRASVKLPCHFTLNTRNKNSQRGALSNRRRRRHSARYGGAANVGHCARYIHHCINDRCCFCTNHNHAKAATALSSSPYASDASRLQTWAAAAECCDLDICSFEPDLCSEVGTVVVQFRTPPYFCFEV